MKEIRTVALIGLGGIGCAYGHKIQDEMPESLKVIADAERIKRYRKNGFIINNKPYNFNYVNPEENTETVDLIILSVKYNELSSAIKEINSFVGKDTIILSFLNGISSEDIIGEAYGKDKLLYSYCVAIDAIRERNKVEFSSSGKVMFGEGKNSTLSEKVVLVKKFFEKTKIAYEIPEDMLHSLWWKFMINIGINQTSAVLKAPYGVFQQNIDAREFMEMAMLEVIAVWDKLGTGLTKVDLKDWYKILDNMSPHGKTSMLQDVEAKRKTEVEMFSGALSKLGKKCSVPTPVNDTLYRLIKATEWMYKE
jgi:2-dehydropantoate 2-reductase